MMIETRFLVVLIKNIYENGIIGERKKTAHHDIAEILLKLVLNTNQSINEKKKK